MTRRTLLVGHADDDWEVSKTAVRVRPQQPPSWRPVAKADIKPNYGPALCKMQHPLNPQSGCCRQCCPIMVGNIMSEPQPS